MPDLAGRSAVVTGGGSGIGAALTRRLVSAGAHVTVADLDLDAAQRTVDSVDGPGTAAAVALDVRDAAAVAAVVDGVVTAAPDDRPDVQQRRHHLRRRDP